MNTSTAHVASPTFVRPIRILIVDDSLKFLESATRLLSLDLRFEVIGWAITGTQAIERVAQLDPDLVLMDIAMPEMNGLDATRSIKARTAPPRVIIITFHNSQEYAIAAEQVHADGFITKSDFGMQLYPLVSNLFGRPED